MNQKKTSKKTSLFEPTYSNVNSVAKDNLRIAKPSILPVNEQPENQINNEDFELKKYYENLNNQINLNLHNKHQLTSLNNQLVNPTNQMVSPFTNQLTNQSIVNQSADELTNQQSNYSQIDQNKKNNYSSYFGINKLTNYFTYSKPESEHSEIKTSSADALSISSSIVNDSLQQQQQNQQLNNNLNTPTAMNQANFYQLPKPHWFYKVPSNNKTKNSNNDRSTTVYEDQVDQQQEVNQLADNSNLDENWLPFAFHDSEALEKAYLQLDKNPLIVVSTNGDRYDCHIKDRIRKSVYWKEPDQEIRRCTWYFKKEGHTKFIPYSENFAFKLEQIYYDVLMNHKWNQRIELNSTNQEMIIFYSYNSIIHYELNETQKDEWNTLNDNPVKPKVVNRELTIDELENYDVCLKEDELYKVDHLVFLVHGVGAICDFRLRSIKEVVDDFRKISLELTRTHFRSSNQEQKQIIGRIEYLPIYWHDLLHGDETQIDERLKTITLKSVPKLRAFANDSVLDALFYTSPIYCQHIINVVTDEINRLYDLFISRNPYFKGTVSLSGHSLGSVILFDLLANQTNDNTNEANLKNFNLLSQNKKLTDSLIYNSQTLKHGQESIKYPKLKFKTDSFFALGSPISMFLMLRGFSEIDPKFHLPDCLHVFNIFHPLDPIAYRIEPMINKELGQLQPVTIPHHKGRKRMHIEIKENLVKMGSDIKEKVIFGIKSTLNTIGVGSFVGMARSSSNLSEINEQLNQQDQQQLNDTELMMNNEENDLYDYSNNRQIKIGSLNNGNRIDFVLQEKPIEFFNQYIFALATHASYWSSEDCVLFMLKELYKLKEIYSIKDSEEANSELNNQTVKQTSYDEDSSKNLITNLIDNYDQTKSDNQQNRQQLSNYQQNFIINQNPVTQLQENQKFSSAQIKNPQLSSLQQIAEDQISTSIHQIVDIE